MGRPPVSPTRANNVIERRFRQVRQGPRPIGVFANHTSNVRILFVFFTHENHTQSISILFFLTQILWHYHPTGLGRAAGLSAAPKTPARAREYVEDGCPGDAS